ncbi:zinc carboxypeptidase-like [Anthonomus grandis grandis]|uniref:zinc carboxypeptidase-like n=1 Tax=Anthonomus grandis grandis TaxID=2921223 RepID=UPI0021662BAA|nr:zinc carboxypeptidase-like [Anthonomus grandis grandis]
MKLMLAALLAVALSQAAGEKLRFDNHTLYRVVPKTREMVELLYNLQEDAFNSGYNFFSEVAAEGVPVDILVPPKQAEQFKSSILNQADVESVLMNENIQEAIDNEGFRPEAMANTFGWTSYHTLDEINAWLRDVAFNYDDKVTLIRGGRTFQGRDILGVKVSFSPANARQSIFIEANIHAREWVTSATATWILNQLLVSQDRNVRLLAESYDWYIFPVANPDGFVHSHTNNRMWRKTRTPYSVLCFGADPNRNWPYQWMTGGASNQPCSDTYAGPTSLSEPSTSSLADFIDSVGENLVGYISFHSFSQMLLLPYGHTTAHLDNYAEMMQIGRKAIQDLSRRYGTQYVVGNIAETIYVASGGSMDWVKHKFGTPVAYTYELRDRGQNGFLLPANQIIPTAEETLDSLVSIFESYRQLHPRN